MKASTLTFAAFVIISAISLCEGARADDSLSVSANVGLVSDYRFRGVSLSDEDIAVQGGIDFSYDGFYAGSWASSIETFNGAETELDLYGGYGAQIAQINWSVGAIAYVYPGGTGTDYFELTASASRDLGPFSLSAGANYAPDQDNIGGEDNIYVYGGAGLSIPATPFSIVGTLGYEDGAFGDEKLNWSLGAAVDVLSLSFSVKYVDTNAQDQFGSLADATVVFSIAARF